MGSNEFLSSGSMFCCPGASRPTVYIIIMIFISVLISDYFPKCQIEPVVLSTQSSLIVNQDKNIKEQKKKTIQRCDLGNLQDIPSKISASIRLKTGKTLHRLLRIAADWEPHLMLSTVTMQVHRNH